MKKITRCVMFLIPCILIMAAVFSLFSQANHQVVEASLQIDNTSPGADIIFIIEDSGRDNGADDLIQARLRYDVLLYAAQVVANDALLFNPGAVHRIGVITYNNQVNDGGVIRLDETAFGPYADTTTGALDSGLVKNYFDDLDSFSEEVRELPTTSIPDTSGIDEAISLAQEMLGSIPGDRVQQVYLVNVGSPQAGEPNREIALILQQFSRFMSDRQLDIFLLPIDSNRFPHVAFAANADLWTQSRPRNVDGTETALDAVDGLSSAIAPYLENALSSVQSAGTRSIIPYILASADANAEPTTVTFEMPAFVAAASFSSFDSAFSLTLPSGIKTMDALSLPARREANDTIYALDSPPPGEYTLSNAKNVKLVLKMAEGVLEQPAQQPQWTTTQLNFTINNLFGEPLKYNPWLTPPVIHANVTHLESNETWQIPLTASVQIAGKYSGEFIPPYAGSYDYQIQYDLSTEQVAQPALYLAQPRLVFDSKALSIAVNPDTPLNFTLYEGKPITFNLEGMETTPLSAAPVLQVNGPQVLRSEGGKITMPFDAQYSASIPMLFEGLPDEGQPAFDLTVNAKVTIEQGGGSTEYTLSDAVFPATVEPPTITTSADGDKTILQAIRLSAKGNEQDQLTQAVLRDFSVQLCALVKSLNEPEQIIPFEDYDTNSQEFEATFTPERPGNYTYQVVVRSTCSDAATQKALIASEEFGVDELFVGFISSEEEASIPSLQQFRPFSTELGFFRQGSNGEFEPFTDPINRTVSFQFLHNNQDFGGASNLTVGLLDETKMRYPVTFAPRDRAETLQIQLQALSGTASLRLIGENHVIQADGVFELQIQPAALTLTMTPAVQDDHSLRQFDNAIIRVTLDSQQGNSPYTMSNFFADGGLVTVDVAAAHQAWDGIPLTLAAEQDDAFAVIPLPVSGSYQFTVNLLKPGDSGAVVVHSDVTASDSIDVEAVSLVAHQDNPQNLPALGSGDFVFEWQDSAGNTIQEELANEPIVALHVKHLGTGEEVGQPTILDLDKQNWSYTFTFDAPFGGEGQYVLEPSWSVSAPLSLSYDEPALENFASFAVAPVKAVFFTLSGDDTQYYYVSLVPFVNIDVRTSHSLTYNLVVREDADNDGSPEMDDAHIIPIRDLIPQPSQDQFDILVEEVLDSASGEKKTLIDSTSSDEKIRQDGRWTLTLPPESPSMLLTLTDIPEGKTYNVQLTLKQDDVQSGFNLRSRTTQNKQSGVLLLSPLTIILPLFVLGLSLLITLVIALVWYIRRERIEKRLPHLEGYLRFEDDLGDLIRWQEDLSSLKRNRKEFRRDERWDVLRVRRIIVTTVENRPHSARVMVWMDRRFAWVFRLLRLIPKLPFDPPIPGILDPGEKLHLPNQERYLVLSDTAKSTNETESSNVKGWRRSIQMPVLRAHTKTLPKSSKFTTSDKDTTSPAPMDAAAEQAKPAVEAQTTQNLKRRASTKTGSSPFDTAGTLDIQQRSDTEEQ